MLRDAIVKEAKVAIEEFARARKWTEKRVFDYALSEWHPLFEKHVPRCVEEIRGMAAGGGFDYAWMLFAAVHGGSKTHPFIHEGCTSVACGGTATRRGKALLGQTKDTSAPLERYRVMTQHFSEGPSCVVLNYPGWPFHIGITSAGLGLTGNSLFGRAPKGETVPTMLLRCLVKEKRTLDEVLAVVRGLSFDNGCMTLGDAGGRLVCLECVNGRVDVRDVSGRAFCHANSILCESLRCDEEQDFPSPSSPLRQRNMERLLASKGGDLRAEDLKAFFADHDGFPLSICRHPSDRDRGWTTAAMVANLTDREMEVAIGNPCVAPFERYGLVIR